MRTLIFIVAGLAVLALLLLLAGRGRRAAAAKAFVAGWFAVSAVNFGIGLSRGYSLLEELLVHAALFGIPALAAVVAWRSSRPGTQ